MYYTNLLHFATICPRHLQGATNFGDVYSVYDSFKTCCHTP